MNYYKDVFYAGFQKVSRYETLRWKLAEKQASEDYLTGNIKTAKSIDDMFKQIENVEDRKVLFFSPGGAIYV